MYYLFFYYRRAGTPARMTASHLPGSAAKNDVPPGAGQPVASELRGRRGIIKQILPLSFIVEPTDSYAQPGELIEVQTQPSTSYILVTIHSRPQADGQSLTRSSSERDIFSLHDDVFIVSNRDIMASTSFSALRIEKIVTP